MNQHARIDAAPIPFIDVAAQRRRLGTAIDDAIARVLGHCHFIMGPEVRALEAELAAFCGARQAISCASGTDALLLPLMAKGIGPGDAVICPSFTFHATAEVVTLLGATPVFADVEATSFNLDPESLVRAVATARQAGLAPKAVIPVDLFGQPADFKRINAVAQTENLFVLDDAAHDFWHVDYEDSHRRTAASVAPHLARRNPSIGPKSIQVGGTARSRPTDGCAGISWSGSEGLVRSTEYER